MGTFQTFAAPFVCVAFEETTAMQVADRGRGDVGTWGTPAVPPAGTGPRLTPALAYPPDPFPPTLPTGIARVPVSLLPLLWANDRKGSGSLCFLTKVSIPSQLCRLTVHLQEFFPKSGSLHIPGPQPVKAKG